MAKFYFIEKESEYILTSSFGIGFSSVWGKTHFTKAKAQQLADAKVGEYIRTICPKEVKYYVTTELTPPNAKT